MAPRNNLTSRAARPDDLHRKVTAARETRGLSKAELAASANVSLRTVQRLERGEGVSADKILRIERALGLDRGTLVPGWDTRASVLSDAMGPRVRELRRSFGHTSKDMAEAIEMSVSTLSRLENGLLGDVDRWDPRIVSALVWRYFLTRRHFDDWVEGNGPTPRPDRR